VKTHETGGVASPACCFGTLQPFSGVLCTPPGVISAPGSFSAWATNEVVQALYSNGDLDPSMHPCFWGVGVFLYSDSRGARSSPPIGFRTGVRMWDAKRHFEWHMARLYP